MKVTHLLRYGLPPEIIRLWQERGRETLLPLQELVTARHDLFGEGNLLVQAPTSAGKTFIGEMAAVQTALRRKRVVYAAPLKALAEEKYRAFSETYAPYGLKTILSTRDHRQFDGDFERGDFGIAVVVYEKLAQLLVRRPERLRELALVVADELELLSDPERGGQTELLLTQLLRGGCRIVGLSAVLGGAERLADWMAADLVSFERRPVELRYGVLHEGAFRYRTYNGYQEETEPMVDAYSESSWEVLTQNAAALVEQGESCLVFVKAKHEARRGAQLLAGRLELPAASEALAGLDDLPATHCRDLLRETLAAGVAFHSADLSPAERAAVEAAFRRGEVKVLVSTSTLATGMNLPARNVFITADKWRYDARFGMPWKAPILRSEYENMGGRAGRYGAGDGFGRSILVAASPFDEETLWRKYVDGQREPVTPRLDEQPLEDPILRLVAARICRTEEETLDFLQETLTGQWLWAERWSPAETDFHVRAAVNRALDAGALKKEPGGRLEATPFGRAAAAKGLTLATASELRRWLERSETREWRDIDLLLAAGLTSQGRLLQLTLTAREYELADYPGRLRELTEDDDLSADVPLNRLRNCNLLPFFEEVRAIKAALMVQSWIDHGTVYDIEDAFHTFFGQLLTAADQLSWLIDGTAALAEAAGAEEAFIERVLELSERVRYGVRPEALPALQYGGPPLGRDAAIALAANGLAGAAAVAGAPERLLAQWVPAAAVRPLKRWAQAAVPAAAETPAPYAQSPALAIDDRRPDAILLDGAEIALQPKQYALVRLLASHPGECVPYERIYEELWGSDVVGTEQMSFQKRELLKKVRRRRPERGGLIRTIPKRGYLLRLTPGEVVLHPSAGERPADASGRTGIPAAANG